MVRTAVRTPTSIHILRVLLGGGLALQVVAYASGVGAGVLGDAVAVHYHLLLGAAAALCIARGTRPDGRPWLALGVAVALWGIGDTYWTFWLLDRPEPPFPSAADPLWLAFYPPAFAGVVILARRSAPGVNRTLWLDGIIGALTAGALGALFAFEAVLSTTDGDTAGVAVNLAYPLADIVLLGLVVGVLVATRGRGNAAWRWLAAGIGCFTIADSAYLFLVATDVYHAGHVVELGWLAAAVLIAHAAWQPQGSGPQRATIDEVDAGVGIPASLAMVAAVLLAASDRSPGHWLGIALALAALGAVLLRLREAHRDLCANLETSRHQALTDPLTQLPNRVALVRDLEDAVDGGEQAVLAILDLDGFKIYNDTFGHLAGDALLQRLATRLQERASEFGARAYRLGGDEFCVLTGGPAAGGTEPLLARLGAALSEHGEGFEIAASAGHALLPSEATTPSAALSRADTRMYAHKGAGRRPTTWQVKEALLAALEARDSELATHMHQVAGMARAVACELGMPDDAVEQVALAAELHDIGKVAIPDEVLRKPGPLNEEEWRFMRQHTLIGQRIVAAAPTLVGVGRLVRSAHERFDGAGYPDGLAGAQIPLGAQIVFVCDAHHAMTSHRPYAGSISPADALEEIRRCSGTQFDPRVVDALGRVQERLELADDVAGLGLPTSL